MLGVAISHNQSTFIPKRLISDNIMLVYESLHSLKIRKIGRVGSITIKLDMLIAYDRVEWSLFEGHDEAYEVLQ